MSSNIISKENRLPVLATNIAEKLFNACERFPDTSFWEQTALGYGDFILQRGNTSGAGWIEISKDPFTPDSETILSVVEDIYMPIRLNIMDSVTHRNAGEQTASVEFVSDDASVGVIPLPTPVPVEILSASQSSTTITVNFAAAPTPSFRVGQVISIYGFVDTRLNVNSATVSSIVSDTQITVVGNDYSFTSTTISTTQGNGLAFIERVDLLNLANNGVSMIHGNGSNTNRRFYTRSQGGLAKPSGTINGSHNVSTGTDAAATAVNTFRAESFLAPLETIMMISRDGVTIADRSTDSNGGLSARFRSTQVVPNPTRPYKLRFRVRSTPSLTRPIAKIVSISKSGSNVATVTTDTPHGLTTGQYVGFYGVRDQAAFANQTTGTTCTVTGPNTFTVTHGSSTTATSYGGFVMRVQGQQPLGGAIAQVAQSVSRTNGILTVVGNASWASPVAIGNIVHLAGFRNSTNGDDLGIDGAYNVINISGSSLVLEPVSGFAPSGADINTTNCGGGVVQRFGYRIHRVMVVDYDPLMTEPALKGINDAGEAQTVQVAQTLSIQGSQGRDSATTGNPVPMGLTARNSNPSVVSASGDLVDWAGTMHGAAIVRPYALPETEWSFTTGSTPITGTADVVIKAAAGSGIKNYQTALQVQNTHATIGTIIYIKDGSTIKHTMYLPPNMPEMVPILLPTPIQSSANTALNVACATAGANVHFNAQGHVAP